MYSNAPWSTKHNREQRRGINHITTIKAHWRRKCRVKLKYLKGRYTSSWARREKRKPFPTHEVSQGTVPIWSSCPIKKDHCSKTTNEKQKINESVTSVILHYLGILRLFVSLNKTIGAFWPPKIHGLFPKKKPKGPPPPLKHLSLPRRLQPLLQLLSLNNALDVMTAASTCRFNCRIQKKNSSLRNKRSYVIWCWFILILHDMKGSSPPVASILFAGFVKIAARGKLPKTPQKFA